MAVKSIIFDTKIKRILKGIKRVIAKR